MTTTARVNMAAGLLAVLNAAKSAGLLQETFAARPGALSRPTPFGFVDMGDEAVTHSEGTRTRVFSPSLVVVDRLTDNAETTARMNALVDAMHDYITARPHLAPNVVHKGRLSVEVAIEQGDDNVWYVAARFGYGDITVQEGRD
jgi:hypothetical protein